jgi:aspartate/methionine/tyrosine aminotransferase
MVFRGNVFLPMATLTKTVPVIAVGGLAKQFLIPGWRVGWITVHDRDGALEDVRTAYFKLSQLTLGANSLVQVSARGERYAQDRSASAQKLSHLYACAASRVPFQTC